MMRCLQTRLAFTIVERALAQASTGDGCHARRAGCTALAAGACWNSISNSWLLATIAQLQVGASMEDVVRTRLFVRNLQVCGLRSACTAEIPLKLGCAAAPPLLPAAPCSAGAGVATCTPCLTRFPSSWPPSRPPLAAARWRGREPRARRGAGWRQAGVVDGGGGWAAAGCPRRWMPPPLDAPGGAAGLLLTRHAAGPSLPLFLHATSHHCRWPASCMRTSWCERWWGWWGWPPQLSEQRSPAALCWRGGPAG